MSVNVGFRFVATLILSGHLAACDDRSPLDRAGDPTDPGVGGAPAQRGDLPLPEGAATRPPAERPPDSPSLDPGGATGDQAPGELRLDDVWGEGVEIDVEALGWSPDQEIVFRVGVRDPATGETLPVEAEDLSFAEDGVPLGSEALFELDRAKDLRVMLVLDLSRSILDADALTPLRQAARTLVESLPREARVAVVGFATDHELLIDFTGDAAQVLQVIDRLQPTEGRAGRFTNLWGAVRFAAKRFETAGEGGRVLVVFTDGRDNVAEVDLATALDAVMGAQATVYAVGLGEDVDGAGLRRLAGDGRVSMTHEPTALTEVFRGIGDRIGESLTVRYVTPKQSGRHTLDVTIDLARGAAGFSTGFSLP